MLNHLKFRVALVEGLLVKYSVQHRVSGHQYGDTIKREMEYHFPRRIPPREKKCKPTDRALPAASIIKERLYTTVKSVIVLCTLMGVSRQTTQEKSPKLM